MYKYELPQTHDKNNAMTEPQGIVGREITLGGEGGWSEID